MTWVSLSRKGAATRGPVGGSALLLKWRVKLQSKYFRENNSLMRVWMSRTAGEPVGQVNKGGTFKTRKSELMASKEPNSLLEKTYQNKLNIAKKKELSQQRQELL